MPTRTWSLTQTPTVTQTPGGPTETATPSPTWTIGIQPLGGETPLITNPTRTPLVINNIGPDSMVAEVDDGVGGIYAYFASGGGGATRTHGLPNFATINRDPDHAVLEKSRIQPNPHGTDASDTFDWDLAGGGQLVQCPSGGKLLYFYHGENLTDPSGYVHSVENEGWGGIGSAYWDDGTQTFVKDDQIGGSSLCHTWCGTGPDAHTCQRPSETNPGAVVDAGDGYLYLYFSSRSEDAEYEDVPYRCSMNLCIGVARALRADVCTNIGTGTKTTWLSYYHGAWTEPSVDAGGMGGKFTPVMSIADGLGPLNLNECFYNTAVARLSSGIWVAAGSLRDVAIGVRTSLDGLAWSPVSQVVVPVATEGIYPTPGTTPVPNYPFIRDLGNNQMRLTYVRFNGLGNRWAYAELDGQILEVVPTPTRTPAATSTSTGTPTIAVPTQQRFCETAADDDGRVNRTSVAYPPTGTTTVTTNSITIDARRSRRTAGDFSVGIALLRFDTSALPDDAIVTAAQLDMTVTATSNANGLSLVGEFYPASNWPIAATAYADAAPTQNVAVSVLVSMLTPGTPVSLTLNGALADQEISRTGSTGFRLHIAGGQPTGANFVELAAQDHATLPEPCLLVSYNLPPVPVPTPSSTPSPTAMGTATQLATATLAITPAVTPTASRSVTTVSATLTPTTTPTATASPSVTPDMAPSSTATPPPAHQQICETTTADDGRVNRTALTYPPGGATTVSTTSPTIDARRSRRAAGDYSVGVVLLRIDTTALPDDAIIAAARLEVYVVGTSNRDGYNLVGEFYGASNWPISDATYTGVAPTTNKALEVPISSLATSQTVSITLDTVLADQQILRAGATALRLHISGGQPSGPNYVEFAAQDDPARPEACLVLDYYQP